MKNKNQATATTNTAGAITAEQLKKIQKIAQEAPQKQKQSKAREQIQKIEQELKALIIKGYNRDEIANMLQMADIKGISKTALKKVITEIKKRDNLYTQEQVKRINRLNNSKGNDKQAREKTQEQTQQQDQRIKLRTERIQAQGTAPAPF